MLRHVAVADICPHAHAERVPGAVTFATYAGMSCARNSSRGRAGGAVGICAKEAAADPRSRMRVQRHPRTLETCMDRPYSVL
jgi:hypothetical protein